MGEALDWSTIAVSGPDAASFLDGQLSQSVGLVPEGTWTLVLEPSGALLAVGWLRQEPDLTQSLCVPSALGAAVVARLERFRMRVRCDISLRPGATDVPLRTVDDRIDQRWPWVPECALGLPPPSFGRTFLAATVSFSKGCFTGQELVGRLDARGASMPWRFVVAFGPSVEAIAAHVTSRGPAGPAGVTVSRERSGTVEALGVAHRSLLELGVSGAVVLEEIN